MNSSSHRRKANTALLELSLILLQGRSGFSRCADEAVVRIPERIAAGSGPELRSERPGLATLLRPGSPVRYFLSAAPVTLAASIAAVIAGWTNRRIGNGLAPVPRARYRVLC